VIQTFFTISSYLLLLLQERPFLEWLRQYAPDDSQYGVTVFMRKTIGCKFEEKVYYWFPNDRVELLIGIVEVWQYNLIHKLFATNNVILRKDL